MSKHPPKRVTGNSKQSQPAPSAGKAYQMRSHLSMSATNKSPAPRGQPNVSPPHTPGVTHPLPTPFHAIVDRLTIVTNSAAICPAIKFQLEAVIQFVNNTGREEASTHAQKETPNKVSEQLPATKGDIEHMLGSLVSQITELHNVQVLQLNGIQDTSNAILTKNDKVFMEVIGANAGINKVKGKISKVMDTTDKIATETKTYRDTLLTKVTPTLRSEVDPKVLGGLDRKAKQILVDMHGEEGNALLSQSLTAILDKANTVLDSLSEEGKPTDARFLSVLKTRGHTILLTLNSKEAATWINEHPAEHNFCEALSVGSHIKLRTYNLILPGIPLSLDPSQSENLHEIEEVNRLKEHSIRKIRWIKPPNRRRPDQKHAYAILTTSSVDNANDLIRNSIEICGARVRPRKQKQEPMQCMKCRRWGHLTADCKADDNTCSRCGDKHPSNACNNKGKTFCVNCEADTHPSWSRECPEFNRRCLIFDKQIPENRMLFFPTEHDWTLITRPAKVLMADRFPQKFAVNAPLPHAIYTNSRAPPKPKGRYTGRKGIPDNPNQTPLGICAMVANPTNPQVGPLNTEADSQTLEYLNDDEPNTHPSP